MPTAEVTEIWVADGAYRPTKQASSDPRSATFSLADGVAVYGGFAGGETAREQRDPAAHQTVLSGDLAQNDGSGDLSENSYHVVSASGVGASAVLDGFTITGGQADGFSPSDSGAGLFVDGAGPTVSDCLFTGNHAVDKGGGFHNAGEGSPTLSDCTFLDNSSDNNGGGVSLVAGGPTLSACLILGNSAGNRGGGMYSALGGSPVLVNCLFSGNSAAIYGGGLATGGTTTLTNCSFSENHADTYGGGIYNFKSDSVLTAANSVFWGNSDGGGTDESAQIHLANGTVTVTYSCVQGWSTPGVDGNIDADPTFVDADGDDDTVGTGDDNPRLQPGSPCIDAGDNSAVPPDCTTDLDGRPRIVDGDGDDLAVVDMGAYEFADGLVCICGDLDDSGGVVDLSDFGLFALCYGRVAPDEDCPPEAFTCSDLNGSGGIDLSDFGTFALLYGATSTKQVPNCLD